VGVCNSDAGRFEGTVWAREEEEDGLGPGFSFCGWGFDAWMGMSRATGSTGVSRSCEKTQVARLQFCMSGHFVFLNSPRLENMAVSPRTRPSTDNREEGWWEFDLELKLRWVRWTGAPLALRLIHQSLSLIQQVTPSYLPHAVTTEIFTRDGIKIRRLKSGRCVQEDGSGGVGSPVYSGRGVSDIGVAPTPIVCDREQTVRGAPLSYGPIREFGYHPPRLSFGIPIPEEFVQFRQVALENYLRDLKKLGTAENLLTL